MGHPLGPADFFEPKMRFYPKICRDAIHEEYAGLAIDAVPHRFKIGFEQPLFGIPVVVVQGAAGGVIEQKIEF